MFIASIAGGGGWGLGNFLLFPAHNPQQQMLLIFITCGISAAAAVSLAADRCIAWGFLIPCALPLEFQLFRYSNDFGPTLSGMGLLYLIFLIGVINRSHNSIRDNIGLRFVDRERERLHGKFAQALHSSQEKLQALFELSPLGCLLSQSNGDLIQVNQALLRMLGYEATEFSNCYSGRLSAPEHLEENRRRWQELVKNGGTDSFECKLVRRDGSWMPASVHRMALDTGDGKRQVWSIIEDITERRRNEQELQELNNRLSLATRAGGIGVWDLEIASNTLLWDSRMCEIYGIDSAAGPVSVEHSARLVHPDDWEAISAKFETALNDPSIDHYLSEFRILWKDDMVRTIRAAGVIRRDETGNARRVIGVAWDITDLKHVARMKSEFVSTVSHELRTPLTSIRGSLGLIASGVAGELPATAQELIDIAYKNSERLSLLINDLLDIERIESGKMRLDLQRHALRTLLEQATAANQGFAQSYAVHLQLVNNLDVILVVDANRFMQIMANLISNAVKFSNADDPVEIAAIDAETRIRIEVRDRGPGIPLEFRERIFQHFSQADASDTRARGGSGLGLAITKTLVEKMQGEIGFVDRSGGGTIFFVEFPRR
jgi:PAS domain S-box-containing protein